MKKRYLWLYLIFTCSLLFSQSLEWTEVTDQYDFPSSVKLYKANRNQPALEIYYLDVDLNDENIVVRPYITDNTATVKNLAERFETYAAINGGFFGGSVSYSAVIYPESVKAQNVGSVTRSGKSYPVIRSLFSLSNDFSPEVDWIYHFSGGRNGIYSFNAPLDYAYNDSEPLSAPQSADGNQMTDLLTGIGGGPTLIKNGQKNVTYNEEVMWGSGVGLDNNDPRTAVGYTENNHIIMIAADGRQTISEGVGLNELADIMLDLGCVEAMNLDGGGSTQMAVPGEFINSPSENRAVPTILAVTHRDSLFDSDTLVYDQVIDTEDEQCKLVGDWFPTANAGYWGESASQLSQIGSGQDVARYNLDLDHKKAYKIYGWWVASSNRCKDTPYVIIYDQGRDTIRVDQTVNHATWNYLGEYTFSPGRDTVIISDAGTQGEYAVADAIAFQTVETQIDEYKTPNRKLFSLVKNYPNPFNASTKIEFKLNKSSRINLSVYNINGREVKEILANSFYSAGYHTVNFNGKGLSSGLYFYELSTLETKIRRKMLLIK